MTTCIALLRGVNVGPHRRLPMAALRDALQAAGHQGVRTHLQSGNVLLDGARAPNVLATQLHELIAAEFGFDVPVVVRTRDELEEVVRRDPLKAVAVDPRRHQVVFLSAEPEPATIRRVQEAELAPEVVAFHGREVYAWHPGGIQRSPLARLLTDAVLGVTATARNWSTVTRLLEMADR